MKHSNILDNDELREFQEYCKELHKARLPKKEACFEIKTPGTYIIHTAASKKRKITVIDVDGELFVYMPLSGHQLLADCKGIKEVV